MKFAMSGWTERQHFSIVNVNVNGNGNLYNALITLRASEAAAQCIVIGPVCLFVGVWVCYHDNSKLRASILTKLGL